MVEQDTYRSYLLDRSWLSEKAFEIKLSKPKSFQFRAGQCIRAVYEGVDRDYSLISPPSDPSIALCVRYVRDGILSNVLAKAEMGTGFTIKGPYGHFIFRPSERPAVFVATGTGIAPFVSMAASGVAGFTLLHGVRKTTELYYETLMRTKAALYVPCLSKQSARSPPVTGVFIGRVTHYMQDILSRAQGAYDFYLCGAGEMIRDATLIIDDLFPGCRVFTETFF